MSINSQCIICKGRSLEKFCGKTHCPIMQKANAFSKAVPIDLKKEFSADAPSVFVGHYGYPKVSVGIMSPPTKRDDTWLHDAPKVWSLENMQIPNIIEYRSRLINSRFLSSIHKPSTQFTTNLLSTPSKELEIAQSVSQATKPVDIEVRLEKKPSASVQFDPLLAPSGPKAELNKISITQNPYIPKQIEKRVSDTDLKSIPAMTELYKLGYDENMLTKLLSVGNLGIGKNRTLVPTRWAITAVDDAIGKNEIEKIKNFEQIQPALYFGGYLGNYFLILFFEDIWSYELFELYEPHASWNQSEKISFSTDYEDFNGRTKYAENCAGGYYAARLSIVESLLAQKKQASCLVIRVITGDYTCPLGVWVVREAVRKAVQSKKHEFETKDAMIGFAKFIVKKKFNFDLNIILKESKIFNTVRTQTKLNSFVK